MNFEAMMLGTGLQRATVKEDLPCLVKDYGGSSRGSVMEVKMYS